MQVPSFTDEAAALAAIGAFVPAHPLAPGASTPAVHSAVTGVPLAEELPATMELVPVQTLLAAIQFLLARLHASPFLTDLLLLVIEWALEGGPQSDALKRRALELARTLLARIGASAAFSQAIVSLLERLWGV